jgi:hypothetical protein
MEAEETHTNCLSVNVLPSQRFIRLVSRSKRTHGGDGK